MTRHRLDQDGDGDFDIYDLLLLVAGLAVAGGLWYAGMIWSVDGFEIAASDRSWIGWLLGFTVTYLEILFNRGSKNETLWWFGVASYGYGFATNIVGIIGARAETAMSGNWWDIVLNILIIAFMASIVEWVPEHIVVRLLRADKEKESDFASEFRKGVKRFFPDRKPHGKQQQPQQPSRNQGHNQGNQRGNDNRNRNEPRHDRDNNGRPPFVPDFSDLPDLRRRD